MTTKKWKPKEGEKYWYIDLSGHRGFSITRHQWHHTGDKFCWAETNKFNYHIGNCFKTKKEAQEMLSKIKKLLKS